MARATLTSPIGTMYSSRYHGTTSLRSTYGTSRTSPSHNFSTTYKDSYTSNYGGSRFQPTPRTDSFGSSRVGSGSSLRRRTSSPAQPRPLPPGPGPLDAHGRKFGNYDSTRGKYDSGNYSTTRVNGPLKADHSTLTGTYSDRQYRASNYTDTSHSGRLTRPRKTNSISDLSTRVDSMQITETSTLSKSRHHGSNLDLTSPLSTPEKRVEEIVNATPRRSKDLNNETILPNIGLSFKSSSKQTSPSSDRKSLEKTEDHSASKGITRRRMSDQHSRNNSFSNGYLSQNSSESSISSKGLVGLRNLGNTCFMNSVLQCLSNTRLLRDFCLHDNYKDEVNKSISSMKGALINAFATLLKSLWKGGTDTYVSPTDFKSQIARFAKRFVGYNQQDAQEFLMYLLEGLHEDLNRITEKKKRVIANDDDDDDDKVSASVKAQERWKLYLHQNDSKIVDIFVGQLKSSLQCTACGYVSNTFDPFWDLSLPIKKGHGFGSEVSLASCFDLFTQEEVLDGDEKPMCGRCKKRQKCTKGFSIQKFPKVLIVHLKRFSQESLFRSKLSTMVDFPLQSLDLSQFAAERSGPPAVYNLFAVSNHSGTPMGGHYTAYAKHPESGEWHHFNDTRVSPISESRVKSSEAYVLFYELTDTSSRL